MHKLCKNDTISLDIKDFFDQNAHTQEHQTNKKFYYEQLITICDSILEQTSAKEKCEHSSMTVNKYLFLKGNKPLKSMLKHNIGCIAFIKCDLISL